MSETTNIEWCDSTFNPWIGCTRVSPACDDCYAARSTPARTLGVVWGAGEARPMSPDWARAMRDQCTSAGLPLLFKQWGEWLPMLGQVEGAPVRDKATTPDGWVMGLAGKKAAGRLLDGIEHNGYPEVSHG